MTFNFDALRAVVATLEAPWVMDAENKAPKEMHFSYLSREAKTWQQIFAYYLIPTTYFREIPVAMLIFISCVLEGKEIYYPQLIRRFMWRAHIRAPTGASTSAVAVPLPPPPAPQPTYLLVQRLFWFMERSKRQLMRRLDRIDQMFMAQGLELPPLPESSGSDEETHEEEHAHLHDDGTHEEEPVHVETAPQTQANQEPVPQPQPEPEPTGVPLPDPQD
ncbi:hypothetical protein AHAS_Ahas09G0126900 [Arachis hypogaea]